MEGTSETLAPVWGLRQRGDLGIVGRETNNNLEKYVSETGNGRHGNHPKYNDWVVILLDEMLKEYQKQNPDPCIAKKLVEKLVEKLLSVINNSNKKINEIGIDELKKLGLLK